MSLGKEIVFTIHDEIHTVKAGDISPETTLNSYLRNKLGLKGTKNMCFEGGCGACCAVIKRTHPVTNRVKYEVVNSCLLLIYACQGYSITTIENVGNQRIGYHEIQKRLTNFHGTQCGYCSPGMVMNMYALTLENDYLSTKDIESNFGGNLCRCTGYRPIMDAFKSMCIDAEKSLANKYPDIEDVVCPKTGKTCAGKCGNAEWDVIHGDEEKTICVQFKDATWYKVYTMANLIEIFFKIGNLAYWLCSGNTGRAIFKTYQKPQIYIDITNLTDIYGHKVNKSLYLGAGTTLTETKELFSKLSLDRPEFYYLKVLCDHINVVANVPVRNVGSLAGNLMLKYLHNEFPSDLFLIFETVGVNAVIVDRNGREVIKSLADFLKYPMYKSVLKTLIFPPLDKNTHILETYKISSRYFNAHAYVNAGFLMEFASKDLVKRARICFGGINKNFIHATATEKYIVGKRLFDNVTLQGALEKLDSEIVPDMVLPDSNPIFRKNLALNLYYKFILKHAPVDKLSPKNISGGPRIERPLSSGSQEYETDKTKYPLTEAVNKIEGLRQAAGEIEYINDIPKTPDEMYGAFVLASTKPFSIINNIDTSKALALKGVVTFITHKDIPGQNAWTPAHLTPTREELLCSGKVLYNGQPIGLIIADTVEVAYEAASLVQVTYIEQTSGPEPLFNIKQVLNSNQRDKRVVQVVDNPAKRKGTDIKHKLQGTFDIGGQYHFSMETQTTLCRPNDEGGFDVFAATQWMDHVQGAISNATNTPMNKINVFVKRVGGAYGCKIVRASLVATACAVACKKVNAPVNIILPLTTNMQMIGKRDPYHCEYDCGFNDDGLIQYLDLKFYHDYGTSGMNEPVFMFTHTCLKGCYLNDTFSIAGYTVQTDMPGNCYCRAPGSVEGVGTIEFIMDRIAMKLGKDPVSVRLANVDPNNDFIKGFFKEMTDWTDYYKRRDEITQFNENNSYKKKGLSLVCMNYGVEIFGPFKCFVAIYAKDGTVCISHGGIEVGQGIHTKVSQTCAYKLGIPLEKVQVKASNNWNSANNIMTGGSLTSEACCYATLKACEELLERLQPIKDKLPGAKWEDIVLTAFSQNIPLTASHMYSKSTPNIEGYFVNGFAVSEVEIDVLTGERNIIKTEIIEDVGTSLSPAIDIGQCEGAFMMGVGYYTLENLIYDQNGGLLTNNTWHYKVPGNKEIPNKFCIKFKKNTFNPHGVLNSKAVGEPPQCLSVSIPLALRQAIASAKYDSNPDSDLWFEMDGPTTIENTLMNLPNNYKKYKL